MHSDSDAVERSEIEQTEMAPELAQELRCNHCRAIFDSTKLNDRQRSLLLKAAAHSYVNQRSQFQQSNKIGLFQANGSVKDDEESLMFNSREAKLREDIIRMILQYLQDEGFHAAKMTLHDEANLKWREYETQVLDMKRIRHAILDGDWQEMERILANKPFLRSQKGLMYAIYKQQYLEYIDHHEFQKAFTFLNKKLKPLESVQPTSGEYRDLCYLLTCKSIHDAPSYRNWEGIALSRERLVEQLQNMINFEALNEDRSTFVPPHRLLTLLRQATAYQVECSRYHPRLNPHVDTLLHDYHPFIIPNSCNHVFRGHHGNVKSVCWVGEAGKWVASGSSDNLVRLWDVEKGFGVAVLEGHASRVWAVSANRSGSILASGSGDGTIRLWDLNHSDFTSLASLNAHIGDVYTIAFHPADKHISSGGYDKTVKLFDVAQRSLVQTFTGHQLSVSSVIYNPIGSLIISGSKDNTIKFWDINSGLCIKTISSHLGEVTSVDMNTNGTLLLSSSKDNSIRLWDIRMVRPMRRYKGHQNTSKNFLRASFANEDLIVSGSEDGMVHIWDKESGDILQRLGDHQNTVYTAVWNNSKSMLASCSDDRTVRTWWYDERIPLYRLDDERMEMERDRQRQLEREDVTLSDLVSSKSPVEEQ